MTSSLPHMQKQQGRPIGRRPVSVRKGSGGRELGGQGARVAGAPHGEMQAGENGRVGIRSSPASHLVDVLVRSQILVWKSASRIGT